MCRRQARQGLHSVISVDDVEPVNDIAAIVRNFDLVANRIVLKLVDETLDVPVERCREQQRLSVRLRHAHDLLHRREESHVGHSVGLVDDSQIHVLERNRLTLDQIFETTWGGNQNRCVSCKFDLGAVRRTTVNRSDLHR